MAEPLSSERVAEIRARCEAATPGPWTYWVWAAHTEHAGEVSSFGFADEYGEHTIADFDREETEPEELAANCAFTVNARTDIPDLLDALTAARASESRVRAAAIEALLVLAVLKASDTDAPIVEISPALRAKLYTAHDELLSALQPIEALSASPRGGEEE